MSESDRGTADSPAVPVCYRHPGRETYVQCVRCERPICPDCMHEASVGHQCPECVETGHRSVRSTRTVFGGGTTGERGTVTRALIGTNVAIWLFTIAVGLVSTSAGASGL